MRIHVFKAEKLNQMQLLGIIFLGFFIIGIIGANMSGSGTTDKISIMSDYFLTKYEYASVEKSELAVYIFYQRIPVFVSLLLLGMTSYRMAFFGCACAWYGFSFGYLHGITIIRYGMKGFALVGGFLLPQHLIYIPVLWFLMKVMLLKNNKDKMQTAAAVGILFILYLLGILVENYINPFFLYQIVKLL